MAETRLEYSIFQTSIYKSTDRQDIITELKLRFENGTVKTFLESANTEKDHPLLIDYFLFALRHKEYHASFLPKLFFRLFKESKYGTKEVTDLIPLAKQKLHKLMTIDEVNSLEPLIKNLHLHNLFIKNLTLDKFKTEVYQPTAESPKITSRKEEMPPAKTIREPKSKEESIQNFLHELACERLAKERANSSPDKLKSSPETPKLSANKSTTFNFKKLDPRNKIQSMLENKKPNITKK